MTVSSDYVSKNFEEVDVPDDGNCFYYALSRTLPEAKDFKYLWKEQKVNDFKAELLKNVDRLIKDDDTDFIFSSPIVRNELTTHLQTDKDFATQPAIVLSAWQLQRCIVIFAEDRSNGRWYVQAYGPTKDKCTQYKADWERCGNCSFLLYEGVGKSEGAPKGTGHYQALKPRWGSREPLRSPSLKGDKGKTSSDTSERKKEAERREKSERRKKTDRSDKAERREPSERRENARASASSPSTISMRKQSSERHHPRKQPPIAPRLLDVAQKILDLAKTYRKEEDIPEAEFEKVEKTLKSLLDSQA